MRSNNNNLDSMNGHLAWNLITQSHDCESSLIDRDQITEPRPKLNTPYTVSRYTVRSIKIYNINNNAVTKPPDTVSRYTGYGTKTEIHK